MGYNNLGYTTRNISIGMIENFLISKENLNKLIEKLNNYKIDSLEGNEYKLISKYKSIDGQNILDYNLQIIAFNWDDTKKEGYLVIEKLNRNIPSIKKYYIELLNKKLECQIDEKYIYLEYIDDNIKFLKRNNVKFTEDKEKGIIIDRKNLEGERIYFEENGHNFNDQKGVKQRIFIKAFKYNVKEDLYTLLFLKEGVSSFGKGFFNLNFLLESIGVADEIRVKEGLNFGWLLYLKDIGLLEDNELTGLSVNLKFIDCDTAEEISTLFGFSIDKSKCLDKSLSREWYKKPLEYKVSLFNKNEKLLEQIHSIFKKVGKKIFNYKSDKKEGAYGRIEILKGNDWISIFSPITYKLKVSLINKYSTDPYYINDKEYFEQIYILFLKEILKLTDKEIKNENYIMEKLIEFIKKIMLI